MANVAQIDQNDKPTLLSFNDTTGLIETVYVDPIYDAVLVYVMPPDGNASGDISNAKIDQNDHATLLGFNETTNLTEALRCGSNGELLVL